MLIAFVLGLLDCWYLNGLFFIYLCLNYSDLPSYYYLRFSYCNSMELKSRIIFPLMDRIMNLIDLKHNFLITFLIIFL